MTTFVHYGSHDAEGHYRPGSWHVARLHTRAINGWKTLCGLYIETTDTMEELPQARSCERCLRIEERRKAPWAEAAFWAYQFAGALTVAYPDIKESDIEPLLDVLPELGEGTVPVVKWPAVVPSLGVPGLVLSEDDASTHNETAP